MKDYDRGTGNVGLNDKEKQQETVEIFETLQKHMSFLAFMHNYIHNYFITIIIIKRMLLKCH